MALPKGFSNLSTAYNAAQHTIVHIIGLVVDAMPPSKTRTGDYMMTLKLLDIPLHEATYGSHGLQMRYFNRDRRQLPQAHQGDVVMLRSVKMSRFSGQPIAISNYQTTTVVFPSASIPDPSYEIAYRGNDRIPALGAPADKDKITLEEQAYVIKLKADLKHMIGQSFDHNNDTAMMKRKRDENHALNSVQPTTTPAARPSSFNSSKFRLVSDLRHFVFADLCVQVVKTFPTAFGCDLYVTDYTANDALFYYRPPEEETTDRERDGDAFGYHQPVKKDWPGPYGYLVLHVNVKEPHAHFINHKVGEGDFVLLRNVKLKIMNEGARLEGDMWPDDRNPDKVQVQKIPSRECREVRDILERKEQYWTQRSAQHLPVPKPPQQQQHQTSNKAEKNRKKREKRKERLAAALAEAEEQAKQYQSPNTNKHVCCSHNTTPLSTVNAILDPSQLRHTCTLYGGRGGGDSGGGGGGGVVITLPFINANYRARVRVVDFHPHELEDFSVPVLHSLSPTSPTSRELSPSDIYLPPPPDSPPATQTQTWEWSFALTLEDATTTASRRGEGQRIQVQVHNDTAQHLFGRDMDDACDLRRHTGVLAKLREKLWILWGNLEEVIVGGDGLGELSNLPFECCIAEYGVKIDAEDDQCDVCEDGVERVAMTMRGGERWVRMYRLHGTVIT